MPNLSIPTKSTTMCVTMNELCAATASSRTMSSFGSFSTGLHRKDISWRCDLSGRQPVCRRHAARRRGGAAGGVCVWISQSVIGLDDHGFSTIGDRAPLGFGEDESGELCVLTSAGEVLQIVPVPEPRTAGLAAARLALAGCRRVGPTPVGDARRRSHGGTVAVWQRHAYPARCGNAAHTLAVTSLARRPRTAALQGHC